MAELWRARTFFSGAVEGGGVNVSHWSKLPLLGTAGVEERIHDFWDSMKGLLSNTLTIMGDTSFDVIDSGTGEIVDAVSVTGWEVVGTNDAAILPRATQGMATVRTGVYIAGRQLRGRMNIPGLCNDSLQNGSFYAPNREDTATRWDAMVGAGFDAVYQVYSTKHHQAENVSSSNVNSAFAVLRSRRD